MEEKNYNSREGGLQRFLIPSPSSITQEAVSQPKCSFFQASEKVETVPKAGSYADYIFQKEAWDPVQKGQFSNMAASENAVSIVKQTTNQTTKSAGAGSCILVSTRQRGNSLLKYLRNVPWEFSDIVPDYILGETCCSLFLSLRYHNLNPEYIHSRLRSLGQSFALRVLLVQVDVKDPHFSLKELAKICILSDCTLILSWSPEEAARYLETYKCYEQKPADALKERTEKDFMSTMTECLTTVKYVNKTDSCTLFTTFGTLFDLANASREDLSLCPGLGPQKLLGELRIGD
ncbi:excision repair cross-complementing 1 [Xenopus laevis]|uniref:DNA excision repair protein ERCC-1 n=2 Tax=Xenopus laevis TaxID=8355 RepID=Q7ZYE2_XENLA|nr:excision repair cross-complementing 1 [Xenopus laevis]AAH43824.1 Ercc1-prov protein [Xenopus laevis]OCT72121.1 hypothetical protein XELAEV_18035087mg [Xenopus laevis]